MEEQTPPPQSQKSSMVNTKTEQSPQVEAMTAEQPPNTKVSAPIQQEDEMVDYEDEIMIAPKPLE